MRTYVAAVVLSFTYATANAGFFDDMVNSAKQTTGQIIESTVDSVVNDNEQTENPRSEPPQGTQATQSTRASSPSPKPYHPPAHVYDRHLVRDIQAALNEHGYNAGKPDGLYGPGTRMAITAYQEDKHLAVDGKPSSALLTSLQQIPKPAADSKPSTPGAGPEEPAPASPAVAEAAPESKLPESTPVSSATPGTFTLPGCDALERWSASHVPDETVTLAPQLQVTSLLADARTVPLFGQPVIEWSQKDITDLRRALGKCRSAARNDKARSRQLYVAYRAVSDANVGLSKLLRIRGNVTSSLDHILNYRPSPRLARQMALAQDALQGKEVDLAAHDLQDMPNWIPRFQHAAETLPAEEIQGYVSQLAQRQAEIEQQFEKLANDYVAAKKELDDAPLSADGMQTLDRLQALPWLTQLTPQEQDEFHNAINRKRSQYAQRQRATRLQAQAGQQAQSKAEASRPIDLRERLVKLFQGDELEELTFGGLSPGMSKQQAISTLERDWKFDFDAGLRINNDFVATRPIFPQLRQERRNGGKVHLGIMDDGKVGQIHYVEYYKAMVVSTTPQAWLAKHLGAPDMVSPAQGGRLLTWNRDGLRLQLLATNQIDQVWRFADFKGKLVVSFWSEDYDEYLAALGSRCEKLLEEKHGRGNMSEAMWFGMNCGLDGGAKEHAGI